MTRLARVVSCILDNQSGWFRDRVAAGVFGRLMRDLIRREGSGTPCPFAGVRDATLSAGIDMMDQCFASELLGDLLVLRLEHREYVVLDLGDAGCYCELWGEHPSLDAAIPRTLGLAPETHENSAPKQLKPL